MMQIHDKQLPWHIASARRNFVFWTTLPLLWSETFWTTWLEVYGK